MNSTVIPRVVDLFHGDVLLSDVGRADPLANFRMIAGAGIWGIIHKATQGLGVDDPLYTHRISVARMAGLLTGAYHFNTGDSVAGQVNHFFDAAAPDDATLMALDWEDNRAGQMTLAQAVEFLERADERLGRPVWLYSGNRAKEQLRDASAEVRATFGRRPLWLCEYGPVARMTDSGGHPLPWPAPTLWQFTGNGIGPQPHIVSGIVTRGVDINSFAGTRDELEAAWRGSPAAPGAGAAARGGAA